MRIGLQFRSQRKIACFGNYGRELGQVFLWILEELPAEGCTNEGAEPEIIKKSTRENGSKLGRAPRMSIIKKNCIDDHGILGADRL